MELGGAAGGPPERLTQQQQDANELYELKRERGALNARLADAEAYLVECGYAAGIEHGDSGPLPVENRLFGEDGERTADWEGAVKRIFQHFDGDDDGRLGYDEFRSYLGFFGRLGTFDANAMLTGESWSMYMADRYKVDEDGNLTFRGFANYVRDTEQGNSLANDVARLGLTATREALDRWSIYKREFDRLGNGEPHMPASNLQLLLYACGEPASQLECQRALKSMLALQHALWPVRKPRHRRKFDARTEMTLRNERPELHPDRLFRKVFLAWCMSRRPTWSMGTWRRRLINFKCGTQASMRRAVKLGWEFRQRVLRCAERGMLATLNDANSTLTTFELQADVGERIDTALGATVNFVSNQEGGLRALDAPYGSRACLLLDLLVRGGTPQPVVNDAKDSLQQFVELHLGRDFERTHVVHSFQIESTEADDGTPILRLMLFLRSAADPDRLLHAAHLIVTVGHFVRSFSAELSCGLSLPELFENRRTTLSTDFSLRATCNATVDSGLLGNLMQEVSYSMDDEAAALLHNPDEPNIHTAARDADEKEIWQLTWRDKIAMRYRTFRDRFRRAATFMRHCKGTVLQVRCESLLELLAARYVEEVLPRRTLHYLQQLVTQPGQAAAEFQGMVESFTNEMVAVGELVLTKRAEEELIEARRRVRRRQERLKANEQLLSKNYQRSLAEELNKVVASGKLDAQGAAAMAEQRAARMRDKRDRERGGGMGVAEHSAATAELLRQPDKALRNHAVDSDLAFLEVYSRGWRALLGPLALRLQTDKMAVEVQFNALDIFELLPEPESIMDGL